MPIDLEERQYPRRAFVDETINEVGQLIKLTKDDLDNDVATDAKEGEATHKVVALTVAFSPVTGKRRRAVLIEEI